MSRVTIKEGQKVRSPLQPGAIGTVKYLTGWGIDRVVVCDWRKDGLHLSPVWQMGVPITTLEIEPCENQDVPK